MKLLSVRITAKSVKELHGLDRFNLDLKYRAARQEGPNKYVVPGILNENQIQKVIAQGYEVEVDKDLSIEGMMRVREISPVNRFAEARGVIDLAYMRTPKGYMNTEEIDSALINLSEGHPETVTLIELPNRTWEGRKSDAVRIRAGATPERPGILFTGSMHAREWGGSDICIHFLYTLLESYFSGTALRYGKKIFDIEQVKSILENLDLFVFPDVNPDGKNYSQNGHEAEEVFWRKNRNPNNGSKQSRIGVDLNRNFDILWTSGIGTSDESSVDIYRGTSAFSEPENNNIKHLLDTYTNIRCYLDIHSYGGLIMYSWGDAKNQSSNPGMNFYNPAYDGIRGDLDTDYREYIPLEDETRMIEMAKRMNEALAAVQGRRYEVKQSVGLYPTSATSDDYAFSRHFVDDSKKKIYGFTIEFGHKDFIPPYSEMKNIIDEVCSAMTELCLNISVE